MDAASEQTSKQERTRQRMKLTVDYEFDERTEVVQVSGQKSGKGFVKVVLKSHKLTDSVAESPENL